MSLSHFSRDASDLSFSRLSLRNTGGGGGISNAAIIESRKRHDDAYKINTIFIIYGALRLKVAARRTTMPFCPRRRRRRRRRSRVVRTGRNVYDGRRRRGSRFPRRRARARVCAARGGAESGHDGAAHAHAHDRRTPKYLVHLVAAAAAARITWLGPPHQPSRRYRRV